MTMPERAGHTTTRDPSDYYATTPELCELVVATLKKALNLNPKTILEPGCGAGTWMGALAKHFPDAKLQGIELHEDLAAYTMALGFNVKRADLLHNNLGDWDLICGNPPYNQLDELMPILLDHLNPGGHLVLLLRLNFLAGQERYDALFASRPPAFVMPLPARPGFTANGGGDGTDYAIYVWTAEITKPGETRLCHLDNRLVENRWSQGSKTRGIDDPRFPDPRINKAPTPIQKETILVKAK